MLQQVSTQFFFSILWYVIKFKKNVGSYSFMGVMKLLTAQSHLKLSGTHRKSLHA